MGDLIKLSVGLPGELLASLTVPSPQLPPAFQNTPGQRARGDIEVSISVSPRSHVYFPDLH